MREPVSEESEVWEGKREVRVVRAAQQGSEMAMEELFRRHWSETHRAAFLVVRDAQASEDIAQEAFISAIRSLDRFDLRRRFAPWLHRITVNRAIDWSRARTHRAETSIESLPPDVLGVGSTQDSVGSGFKPLMAKLTPEHRAVVVLRYLLDYTPGEIARMLDLPRGTVNSRLRRALDSLGEDFEREEL